MLYVFYFRRAILEHKLCTKFNLIKTKLFLRAYNESYGIERS